jgi:hypothetical protein
MAEFAVILFHSTSHAVHAERVLQRAGLQVRMIPTPRHLSSDCDSALRIAARDQARSVQALEAAGAPCDRIAILDGLDRAGPLARSGNSAVRRPGAARPLRPG